MTDLLVYVNDNASCSIIFEDANIMLNRFRHDILNEQVDDILTFPYKFMRNTSEKRVVVGLKQEIVTKLRACIEESDATASLYLIREDTKTEVNISNTNQKSVPRSDVEELCDLMEQLIKKVKISRQPSLLQVGVVSESVTGKSSLPYSAARARKCKLFTDSEINASVGMVKVYREFWNNKAEEICSSQALKSFKPGEVQGAINVAWALEKSKDQAEEVSRDIDQQCPAHLLYKFQMSKNMIDKNKTRVDTAEESFKKIQNDLTKARFALFECKNKVEVSEADKIEKDLAAALTELQKSKDSLRKAIEARKRLINTAEACEMTFETSASNDKTELTE